LFVFPFAGGNVSNFQKWPKALEKTAEVYYMSCPLLKNAKEIASVMASDMLPLLDKPYVMYGHCLGGIVMYETLLELIRKDKPLPFHLFVAGTSEPKKYLLPMLHEYETEYLARIMKLAGFPKALERKEIMEEILPILRTGFEASCTYCMVYDEKDFVKINIPITAFASIQDLLAGPHLVYNWKDYTTGAFKFWLFEADHYFPQHFEADLLTIINQYINGAFDSVRFAKEYPRKLVGNEPILYTKYHAPIYKPLEPLPFVKFKIVNPQKSAKARLFIFPAAHGRDSVFVPLITKQGLIPPNVEVCHIQIHEWPTNQVNLFTRISDVVDAAYAQFPKYLDKPFFFFGQCYGAIIAFEIAARLQKENKPVPRHLFATSTLPPHYYCAPNFHLLDEKVLIDGVGATEFPEELDPKMPRVLRACFEMITTYRYLHEPNFKLHVPITVRLNRRDALCAGANKIKAWAETTDNTFVSYDDKNGNHYYLEKDPRLIMDLIAKAASIM